MEDFDSGRTLVLPEEGRGLDPAVIARAIRDAGFTPAKIEIRAEGTIEAAADGLSLRVEGLETSFALEGEKLDELRRKAGAKVLVTGELKLLKNASPRLAVETIE